MSDELRDLFSPERLRRSWQDAEDAQAPPPAAVEAVDGAPSPTATPLPAAAGLAGRLARCNDAQLCARLQQLVAERARGPVSPAQQGRSGPVSPAQQGRSGPGGALLVELVERLLVVVERHRALLAGGAAALQDTEEDNADEDAAAAPAGPAEGAAAEAALVAEITDPAALAKRTGELLDQLEDLCDAQRLGAR